MKFNGYPNDEYKLSSGKEFYAHMGLISIRKENHEWQLYDGYDSNLYLERFEDGENLTPQFTKAELIEIANYQIDLWNSFRVDVLSNKVPCVIQDKLGPIKEVEGY